MHSLKNTLGKDGENDELSVTRGNPSKTFSKSKNGSMWTLDPDEEDQEQKIRDLTSKRLKEFQLKIISMYEKDPTFSEIVFFEIIEQIQSIGEEMDELSRLQLAERAAQRLNQASQQQLKVFLTSFLQCLLRRIRKIKKKTKKIELQQYEKIVKSTFKKKSVQYIDQANFQTKEPSAKPNNTVRNNAINSRANNSQSIGQNSSSKRNGSASSTQGKLGKLISNGAFKDEKKQEQNEENQDHQTQNVSFSSMVSQSMAVRQRKPKQLKKDQKEKQDKKPRKESQSESNGKDEAFIFYRPKAGKKN